MHLPKDVSIVKMPRNEENAKYEIPPSEYIWNAPYLKKTQIFPSYVRKYFLIYKIGHSSRLSNSANAERIQH